jgi:L-2-hydroxyglutarate oxidase
MSAAYNIAIVGGGVLGCALARALALKVKLNGIVLLEKEDEVALHASGRNSSVVHSGFHLKPGSLKAQLCVEGARQIADYCREKEVPYQQVGKLVIVSDQSECDRLPELAARALANGLNGARVVDAQEIHEIEPHARGLGGFYSPTDGIIDSRRFVWALAEDATRAGVELKLRCRLLDAREESDHVNVKTNGGDLQAKWLINCAGLYADRVARSFGVGKSYTIIPFRGEYFSLVPEKRKLIRGLIYPMPHPELPFLGVHFTRTVDGGTLIGPNAVLAMGRESYANNQIHWGETASILFTRNFIRMISQPSFFKIALKELKTSLSKRSFIRQAQRLVPEIAASDVQKQPARAGIRAQLVDRSGQLVEDFVIEQTDRSLHILNAVSPGFTSSLAFADYVVAELRRGGYIASTNTH